MSRIHATQLLHLAQKHATAMARANLTEYPKDLALHEEPAHLRDVLKEDAALHKALGWIKISRIHTTLPHHLMQNYATGTAPSNSTKPPKGLGIPPEEQARLREVFREEVTSRKAPAQLKMTSMTAAPCRRWKQKRPTTVPVHRSAEHSTGLSSPREPTHQREDITEELLHYKARTQLISNLQATLLLHSKQKHATAMALYTSTEQSKEYRPHREPAHLREVLREAATFHKALG
ncbi:hypothetical protein EBH_0085760 [Eimeria brunetti]|uniref:Uncharacterized protein n=1 Tax=Eimeria brunetti TaxID=51314 RepID=U6LK38_9EIME|nr:hypothetical protein EBH_0085760 [Eimeria brunetti]